MPSLRPQVDPGDIKVKPHHLQDLGKIHELLQALNDPLAGQSVEKLVQKIPILAARCLHRALSRTSKVEISGLDHALRLIGNRGIEAELLTLLEDLTIAKSELEFNARK